MKSVPLHLHAITFSSLGKDFPKQDLCVYQAYQFRVYQK